jgi:hypothetical protein
MAGGALELLWNEVVSLLYASYGLAAQPLGGLAGVVVRSVTSTMGFSTCGTPFDVSLVK